MHKSKSRSKPHSPKFEKTAPWVIQALVDRYQLEPFQAAGPLGNFGRETAGFLALRERQFVDQPRRGGWGWAQWSGPRAAAFLKWCSDHHLDWRSDGANLGFLFHELDGPYKGVVKALRETTTLLGATIVFEEQFEQAGVPAIAERVRWAELALESYNRGKQEA